MFNKFLKWLILKEQYTVFDFLVAFSSAVAAMESRWWLAAALFAFLFVPFFLGRGEE